MAHAITSPITCYALLALGLGLCLFLFATVKAEIAALRKKQRLGEIARTEMAMSLDASRVRLRLEEQAPPAAAAGQSRAILSPGKREQALRLAAHGKTSGEIAKALGIASCEADLLLKVHRIALKLSASGSSPEPVGKNSS
jgi:DNA-binding NarL/FixJ family response regulator